MEASAWLDTIGRIFAAVPDLATPAQVQESLREILEDHFDMPHLDEVVGGIESGAIEVVVRETEGPSPFAASHARQLVRALLEEGDRQQPEYREVMLSLDRSLLRELLGTTSLRDLLEPEAIAEV